MPGLLNPLSLLFLKVTATQLLPWLGRLFQLATQQQPNRNSHLPVLGRHLFAGPNEWSHAMHEPIDLRRIEHAELRQMRQELI
jgi:hypothetical protein